MATEKDFVRVRKVREGYVCFVNCETVRRSVRDDGTRLFFGDDARRQLVVNLSLWGLPVLAEAGVEPTVLKAVREVGIKVKRLPA